MRPPRPDRRPPSPPKPSSAPRRPTTKPGAKPGTAKKGSEPAHVRRARPEQGSVWTPGPGAHTVRAEAGLDLAHLLVRLTEAKLSVRAARRHIENGNCRVNGRVESFHSYAVVRGDIIEFFLPEEREHRFDKTRILHEESGLLAYDKPPYLPVTPQDGPKSWSLVDILKPRYPDLIPVHRLDADTSGIVLFARNATVAERLEHYFKEHEVRKTYHALVRGHPHPAGTHKSYLIKTVARKGFEQWQSGRGQDAREAITTWTVEREIGRWAALVKVEPKTGRYHQIRIHFSEMGHPLYGDRLYGDRRDPVHVDRHQLHAGGILLPNPCGGPILTLKSPLPADMLTAIERLTKL